jgi:hypothetical protein
MAARQTAALGFSVHTGWAVLVAVSVPAPGEIALLDRRRIVMIPDTDREEPRFVYHAARELELHEAEQRVRSSSERARRNATEALDAAVKELGAAGRRIVASGVIGGGRTPASSLEAILKSHSLVHAAEGTLFREAVRAASESLELRTTEVPAKELTDRAARRLGLTPAKLETLLARVGREAGPPWAKDQRDACLAAVIALPG